MLLTCIVFAGRSTINAFGMQQHFIDVQSKLTDENHVFNFASFVATRFLGFYADLAGNILILAAALFAVARRGATDFEAAGSTGLSLSYILGVCMSATYSALHHLRSH